jgi:Arylsulfotransferase (ASST)
VGIVTFTTSLSELQSAQIDFGLTTSYGMTAPVDLAQTGYRTLLLGMKQSKTYHYRVTATTSAGSCQSSDSSIMTGTLPSGLPQISLSPATSSVSGLSGGFLLSGQYNLGGSTSPRLAYIVDGDGDFVWAASFPAEIGGAIMSYDGSHMWINSVNYPSGGTHVHRVSMDGMTDEDLTSKFSGQNHQMTVEADESVAFYARGSGGCDDLKEYSPSTGNVKTVVNTGTAQGLTSGSCHINNVQYSEPDDSLVFSDLNTSTIVKVKRSDGSVIWNLNGAHKTLTGATWSGGQHGIDLMDQTHVLIFNNNNGGGGGSVALELVLDSNAKTISKNWSYAASPAIANQIMGDVQRMPNGNTVVAYSTRGILHEVDASGKLLQTWTWGGGALFGYTEKRLTLYGPPPR